VCGSSNREPEDTSFWKPDICLISLSDTVRESQRPQGGVNWILYLIVLFLWLVLDKVQAANSSNPYGNTLLIRKKKGYRDSLTKFFGCHSIDLMLLETPYGAWSFFISFLYQIFRFSYLGIDCLLCKLILAFLATFLSLCKIFVIVLTNKKISNSFPFLINSKYTLK
jgi:hypothetical protein